MAVRERDTVSYTSFRWFFLAWLKPITAAMALLLHAFSLVPQPYPHVNRYSYQTTFY